MPTPLDPATLPDNVVALRTLLLRREDEHAAELAAARDGLKEQVLCNEQLKLRLAKLLRERFGASSEKLRGAIEQLELTLADLEEKIGETTLAEAAEPDVPPETDAPRRKPARKPLPETLPRDVVEHAAPCACPKCGGSLRPLGEDVTEVLEYVPGSFRVTRHVRPKLSCRACETIAQAPAPSLPIYRGLAGPGLLAHVLVAKYCDHQPLYRQAEIYARDGIDLERSTLADWVGQTARLMRPLVEAVGAHVMAADRVHADDTTVPVLDPGRGHTKTGRLWCYVRDDRPFGGPAPPAVLYHYSPDRKGEHPREHLSSFRGILQADGYAGYAGLYDRGVTEAACWAHARRKFFEVQATTQSPLATEALQRIAALYRIEVVARGQAPDDRLATRAAKKRAVARGASDLAGENPASDLRQKRSGRCDPLHPVTLGGADTDSARRPDLHRQQRSRTIDAADVSGTEKLVVCRFGLRWGAGGRGVLADRNREAERSRSRRLPAPGACSDRRPSGQAGRRVAAMEYAQRPSPPGSTRQRL